MSDGSGCLHEAMKNSFKIPTSMECAQCGKSELLILRHRIASAEQDKLGLIKVTHGLQDRIASLEAENQRLRAVIDDMATDPMGEYHTGLRCGVEDRDIACRYEAAEYGWEQAFEYIGSIATGALLGGGE